MSLSKNQREESRFLFAREPDSTPTSNICAATQRTVEAMSRIIQKRASNPVSSEQVCKLRAELDTLDLQLAKLLNEQTNAANEISARALAHSEDNDPHNKRNEVTDDDKGFVLVGRDGRHQI